MERFPDQCRTRVTTVSIQPAVRKVMDREGRAEAPSPRGVSGRYRSMTASMSGSIRGGGDASEMPKNSVIDSSSATNPPLMP